MLIQRHSVDPSSILLVILLILHGVQYVDSNAMLTPSHRGLVWTKRNHVVSNYNYMEIKCGGIGALRRNDGECGLCGDPFDRKRLHEFGGKYSTGAIAKTYKLGENTMKIKILLNSDLGGYFIFHLCEANGKKETQACFDKHFLKVTEGRWQGDEFAYVVQRAGIVHLTLEIPPGLTCDRCVLQWKYMTSNTWGRDPDGTGCLGCGVQEQYVNCADVRIKGWTNITLTTPYYYYPSSTVMMTPPSYPPTLPPTPAPTTQRPTPAPTPAPTRAPTTRPPTKAPATKARIQATPFQPRNQGLTTRRRSLSTDRDEGSTGGTHRQNRIPGPPKSRPYAKPSSVTLVVKPAIPPPTPTTIKTTSLPTTPKPLPVRPPNSKPFGPNRIPRPPPPPGAIRPPLPKTEPPRPAKISIITPVPRRPLYATDNGRNRQENGYGRQEISLKRQDNGVERPNNGYSGLNIGVRLQNNGYNGNEIGLSRQDNAYNGQNIGVRSQNNGNNGQNIGVRRQDNGNNGQNIGVRRQDNGYNRHDNGAMRHDNGNRRHYNGYNQQNSRFRSQNNGYDKVERGLNNEMTGYTRPDIKFQNPGNNFNVSHQRNRAKSNMTKQVTNPSVGFNPFAPDDVAFLSQRNRGPRYNQQNFQPDQQSRGNKGPTKAPAKIDPRHQEPGLQEAKPLNIINEYVQESAVNPNFDKRMKMLNFASEYHVTNPTRAGIQHNRNSGNFGHVIGTHSVDRNNPALSQGNEVQTSRRLDVSPFGGFGAAPFKPSTTTTTTLAPITPAPLEQYNGMSLFPSANNDQVIDKKNFGAFLSPLNKRSYMVNRYNNVQATIQTSTERQLTGNKDVNAQTGKGVSRQPDYMLTPSERIRQQQVRQRQEDLKRRLQTVEERPKFTKPLIRERFTNFHIGEGKSKSGINKQVNTGQNSPKNRLSSSYQNPSILADHGVQLNQPSSNNAYGDAIPADKIQQYDRQFNYSQQNVRNKEQGFILQNKNRQTDSIRFGQSSLTNDMQQNTYSNQQNSVANDQFGPYQANHDSTYVRNNPYNRDNRLMQKSNGGNQNYQNTDRTVIGKQNEVQNGMHNMYEGMSNTMKSYNGKAHQTTQNVQNAQNFDQNQQYNAFKPDQYDSVHSSYNTQSGYVNNQGTESGPNNFNGGMETSASQNNLPKPTHLFNRNYNFGNQPQNGQPTQFGDQQMIYNQPSDHPLNQQGFVNNGQMSALIGQGELSNIKPLASPTINTQYNVNSNEPFPYQPAGWKNGSTMTQKGKNENGNKQIIWKPQSDVQLQQTLQNVEQTPVPDQTKIETTTKKKTQAEIDLEFIRQRLIERIIKQRKAAILKEKQEKEALKQKQLQKEREEKEALRQQKLLQEQKEKEALRQKQLLKEQKEKEELRQQQLLKEKQEKEALRQQLLKEKREKEALRQQQILKEKQEIEALRKQQLLKEQQEKEALRQQQLLREQQETEALRQQLLKTQQEIEALRQQQLQRERREKEALRQQQLLKEQREKEALRKQLLIKQQEIETLKNQQRIQKEQREKEALRQQQLQKEQQEKEALRQKQLLKEKQEKEALRQQQLLKEKQEKEALRQQQLRKEKEALRQQQLLKEKQEKEALKQQQLLKEQQEKDALIQQQLLKEQKEKEAFIQQQLLKEQKENVALRQQMLRKEQQEKEEIRQQQLLKEQQEKEALIKQQLLKEEKEALKQQQLLKKQKEKEALKKSDFIQNKNKDQVSPANIQQPFEFQTFLSKPFLPANSDNSTLRIYESNKENHVSPSPDKGLLAQAKVPYGRVSGFDLSLEGSDLQPIINQYLTPNSRQITSNQSKTMLKKNNDKQTLFINKENGYLDFWTSKRVQTKTTSASPAFVLPTSKKPTLHVPVPDQKQTTAVTNIASPTHTPVLTSTRIPLIVQMRNRMLEKIRRANQGLTEKPGSQSSVIDHFRSMFMHKRHPNKLKTTLRNPSAVLKAFQTTKSNNVDKQNTVKSVISKTTKSLFNEYQGNQMVTENPNKVKHGSQSHVRKHDVSNKQDTKFTTQGSKSQYKLPMPEMTTKSYVTPSGKPASFVKSTVNLFVNKLTRNMEEKLRLDRATGKVKSMPLSKDAILNVLKKIAMNTLEQGKSNSSSSAKNLIAGQPEPILSEMNMDRFKAQTPVVVPPSSGMESVNNRYSSSMHRSRMTRSDTVKAAGGVNNREIPSHLGRLGALEQSGIDPELIRAIQQRQRAQQAVNRRQTGGHGHQQHAPSYDPLAHEYIA